ncbi:MAG: hypothetical protein P1P64_06210 [Treponemataceae bacterium]
MKLDALKDAIQRGQLNVPKYKNLVLWSGIDISFLKLENGVGFLEKTGNIIFKKDKRKCPVSCAKGCPVSSKL